MQAEAEWAGTKKSISVTGGARNYVEVLSTKDMMQVRALTSAIKEDKAQGIDPVDKEGEI